MADSLVHSFSFVVFTVGVVIFLLLLLCERFYCFEVLTPLLGDFREVVIVYAGVGLTCVALLVLDD